MGKHFDDPEHELFLTKQEVANLRNEITGVQEQLKEIIAELKREGIKFPTL